MLQHLKDLTSCCITARPLQGFIGLKVFLSVPGRSCTVCHHLADDWILAIPSDSSALDAEVHYTTPPRGSCVCVCAYGFFCVSFLMLTSGVQVPNDLPDRVQP